MAEYPNLADIMSGHSIEGNLKKYIERVKLFKDKTIRDKLIRIGDAILRHYDRTPFGFNADYATVLETLVAFERYVDFLAPYLEDDKEKDETYDLIMNTVVNYPYWKW